MALSARTAKPLPSQAAEYRDAPPTGMRLGIALSGGGIRSAAFNLGALQALQKRHVLEHADYLAAVSGGNYIASAITISGAYHRPECDNGKPAWAHGSAEERYLRQHTNYLAPGAKGRVWLGLNICFGFVLNYLPFLLCAFVVGRVIGWLLSGLLGLKQADPRLDGLDLPSSALLTAILGIIAASVLGAVALVGYRRFKDGWHARPADYGETRSEGLAYSLIKYASALAGVGVGLPLLAGLYGWNPDPHSDYAETGPAGRITRRVTQRRVVKGILRTRLARTIIDGWREPGALYVLREALGATRSSHRFIYLTDGGHWENLGLVELLRRRCTHVLCFDATSGDVDGLDIGRAMALARSELGVDIEMDPRPTMPAKRFSDDVAVLGSIKYPDPEQEARLVYARAVLTERASWDLLAYQARDGRFPNHSTSQQIFTDEQFESYRALGYQAGCRALELLNIPEVLLHRVPAGIASPDGAGSLGSTGNGHVGQPRDGVPPDTTVS